MPQWLTPGVDIPCDIAFGSVAAEDAGVHRYGEVASEARMGAVDA
jgi:hypothetical protein